MELSGILDLLEILRVLKIELNWEFSSVINSKLSVKYMLLEFLQDLIPPSYLNELSLLQDQIAPFSTNIAFDTIEQELGLPIYTLFSEISPEPVAAASLGQVYQARLRTSGNVVAIKVQRPGVRAAISLDLLILRYLTGLIRIAGKFNTDLQAIIDEWASSLFRVIQLNAGDGLQD